MSWFKLLKKDETVLRNEVPCKICTNTTYTRYGLEFQCTDCGHNSEEMAEKYLSRSQLKTRAKKQRVSRTPSKKERNRKKREARRAKRAKRRK
tara:strand:- start:335 stop:613 length:279 start_codon:yes stop_codon:yes gene_type:complete